MTGQFTPRHKEDRVHGTSHLERQPDPDVDTATDRTVDELSGGFEAAASFAEHCRVLVRDRVDEQADEFVRAGKTLHKRARYALMGQDRERTGPAG